METLSRTPTVEAVRADGVGNVPGALEGAVAESAETPTMADDAENVTNEAEADEARAVAEVVAEPGHGAAEPERDVEALVEAAERRGFERGLSAAGGRGGGQVPSLWQAPPAPVKGVDEEETRQLSFLSYIRPSVWD